MRNSPVIGIDGSRLTVGERTGTENYSYQLLKALAALEPADPIRVYIDAETTPSFVPDRFEYVEMPFPRLWTHTRLSWEMARRPPGVLFVPAHVIPLWHPRSVVTIHDLGWLYEPGAHSANRQRELTLTTKWSCRVASKIIAISSSTKRDLVEKYGVAEEKVRVIYHGVSQSFSKATDAEIARVRATYALPEDFILFVGTVQPRKNIPGLALAIRQLRKAGFTHKLVIAGKPGWLYEQVERQLEVLNIPDLIVRLGYVPDADLPGLYSAADAFCLPSLYEGFGMPLLEAMACEAPVVTSNTSSLPEIAGDAALLVDPRSEGAIAEALIRVISNSDERSRLIEAGRRRVREFTWTKTAEETLRLLREARDQ